jgi:hypothetical protein
MIEFINHSKLSDAHFLFTILVRIKRSAELKYSTRKIVMQGDITEGELRVADPTKTNRGRNSVRKWN